METKIVVRMYNRVIADKYCIGCSLYYRPKQTTDDIADCIGCYLELKKGKEAKA